MPDPRKLKVGDLVRFVAMPNEWSEPNITLPRESRAFMKAMVKRRFPSRVSEIDEFGLPRIKARMQHGKKLVWHTWTIIESTGWRRVMKRT